MMPLFDYWPIILIGAAALALLIWSLVRQLRRSQAQKAELQQLGFQPCPEQKAWLEETVARLEQNRGYRYEVRDPKRLPGEPAVYFYVKVRYGHSPHGEESAHRGYQEGSRKPCRAVVATVNCAVSIRREHVPKSLRLQTHGTKGVPWLPATRYSPLIISQLRRG